MTDLLSSHTDIVHKQWARRPADERYIDLDSLHAYKKGLFDRCSEGKINTSRLVAQPTGDGDIGLSVDGKGRQLVMNNWSFGQLCVKAGAPASYLSHLPADIASTNLNHGLKRLGNVSKLLIDNETDTIRAITSETYGRIPDHHIVELVQRFAGNGTGDTNWRAPGVLDWATRTYDPFTPVSLEDTTFYASDRDCFIFLCSTDPIYVGQTPDGKDDLLYRALGISTSEVGGGAVELFSMWMRGVCKNRNVWGVEDFQTIRIRHSRWAGLRVTDEIIPQVENYRTASTDNVVAMIRNAKGYSIAKNDDEAETFLVRTGLTKSNAKSAMALHLAEETVPVRSAWDASQAVTALARSIVHQDKRTDLERIGSGIVSRFAA